jgi:hypothetical protein
VTGPYDAAKARSWVSFTHLPSGHLVSTVMLGEENDEPTVFGTAVQGPDGIWSEERLYDSEDEAREGHLDVVAKVAESER